MIPNKEGVIGISSPIRFVGRVYKIMAKALANRLRKFLPHIILEEQGAQGHKILDLVFIAHEIIDSHKKLEIQG